MGKNGLTVDGVMLHGDPLWRRVPTRDNTGRPLSDFMMLIPRLSRWPEVRREQALQGLQQVFDHHRDLVVFADLNMKLNLLWVSLKVRPGGCWELVTAVREVVPEAVLVASHAEVLQGMAKQARKRRFRFGLSDVRARWRLLKPKNGSQRAQRNTKNAE